MKIRILMIAVLCGLSSPAFGKMISSYFDNKKYDFEFSCDDVSKTPAWPEENASPPLEPREAVRVARAQLSTLMQDSERWRLNHVSLRPACTERHWFYVVTFSPPPPRSDGGATPLVGLVVLMNGQTIEPKVSPWRSAFQADAVAKGDPITRLVGRLAASPDWRSGTYPSLELPATASTDQVLARVFEMTSFEHGRVKQHRILETRVVQIADGLPHAFIAVLVRTELGDKIVLMQLGGPPTDWWSRVYDVQT